MEYHMMQPCKTLSINTPQIWKMYKGIRRRRRENLQDVKLAQARCQNLPMSKTDHL
jgi:hypothetical protein